MASREPPPRAFEMASFGNFRLFRFGRMATPLPDRPQALFEWYRQRAEELRRGETAKRHTVRLRVPPGIGRINMLHLNVAADGTVEMPEEEAESFLRAGGSG